MKEKNYYHLERAYGSFCRVIDLPKEVDRDRAKAGYKNGTREITLPGKSSASGKEARIKID